MIGERIVEESIPCILRTVHDLDSSCDISATSFRLIVDYIGLFC